MSYRIIVFLFVLGMAVTSQPLQAADEGMAGTAPEAVAEADVQSPDAAVVEEVGNKLCLVSGHEVGEMGEIVKKEYKGKIYNFCCAACLKDFDKDPESYIKAYEEKYQASESSTDTVQQNK